ncbi:MAG TPA: hydroxyisourate hydrolase [Chloroflexia bacterium]|nr:hydroxyisourate hydrolase [Chloroflexia bacterium]
MPGRLTTHVLDTSAGAPAAGVKLSLFRLSETEGRVLLKEVSTNIDGRTDIPLLSDAELEQGIYELVFLVGDYFRRRGMNLPDPAFISDVPVRFGVADTEGHYHVPLLVSPWAYSTYRGS